MSGIDGFGDKVSFIWSVADLLRGDVRQHEYGQFILPFVLLRADSCPWHERGVRLMASGKQDRDD